MFWLAQDGRTSEEGTPSRGVQSALDFYSCLRRLQSGAHAKSGHRISSGVSRAVVCLGPHKDPIWKS